MHLQEPHGPLEPKEMVGGGEVEMPAIRVSTAPLTTEAMSGVSSQSKGFVSTVQAVEEEEASPRWPLHSGWHMALA